MASPLFASGTARGGTNLMTMMLSVHPQISLSQDPYIPLFRSFRNAVVAASGDSEVLDRFDPEGPLDEYYYYNQKLAVMGMVQDADLSLSFDRDGADELVKSLGARASLSSPRLVPYVDQIRGEDYKELFEAALKVVALGRDTPNVTWLGWNDNWTVEFFPALARSIPDAKFVVLLRDVRSSIASHVRTPEAHRVSLTTSFTRCWRKQVALARHYQQMPLFEGRLKVMTYEQLAREPEQRAREFCEFLNVDYLSDMVDGGNFESPEGGPWEGNSNFADSPKGGIYLSSMERWKTALPEEQVRLIEFVAGPDLQFAGYRLNESLDTTSLSWGAYEWHVRDHEQCQGWRTDSGNPDVDFALELLRRGCLRQWTDDVSLIERCFLFPEMYRSLHAEESLFPAPVAAA